MKRLFQILLAAGLFMAPGCGFFTGPDEARFGDLQINIRFAGTTNSGEAAKRGMVTSPQALDRIVVIVFEYSFQDAPDNEFFDRELIRREFRLGAERQLQATIQVPLENPEFNCFRVVVRAFQGNLLLYSGEDPSVCFDEENKSTQANILLDPLAFSLFVPGSSGTRLVTLSGTAQDTTITEFEIVADSVRVRIPVQNRSFVNPIMLFGDNTLIRMIAYRDGESSVQALRQVTYTGPKSDVLVVLVWDQLVDLNLEILNPRQRLISALDPGDDIDGRLLPSTGSGYGPEVFEWRTNSTLTGGQFAVNVSRPRATLGSSLSGRVYYLRGERTSSLRREVYPFTFEPTELQKTFDPIIFP